MCKHRTVKRVETPAGSRVECVGCRALFIRAPRTTREGSPHTMTTTTGAHVHVYAPHPRREGMHHCTICGMAIPDRLLDYAVRNGAKRATAP